VRFPAFHLPGFATRSEASQLVEFAVALPLLVVFVVGIFDFGQAFNLKLKLNGAARQAARLGSSLPTSDLDDPLSTSPPVSVDAVRSVVDSYLKAAGMNDCGLFTQTGTLTGTLTWTYIASGNGCVAPLTVVVNRAYGLKTTVNGIQTDVICTQVTLSYPFQWHFNSVIQLLVPGASYAGTTLIPTDAIAPNMD
jgi:Flp pilus assembly protein TadG